MREALRLLANVRIASRRVAGLAIGTEIQVPLMYAAEVVSTCPLGYPPFSVHPISVFASFVIPGYGPQNFSSEGPLQYFQRTQLADGNGLYSLRSSELMVTAHVGDVLPISATALRQTRRPSDYASARRC
jgi:hypothetical protein